MSGARWRSGRSGCSATPAKARLGGRAALDRELRRRQAHARATARQRVGGLAADGAAECPVCRGRITRVAGAPAAQCGDCARRCTDRGGLRAKDGDFHVDVTPGSQPAAKGWQHRRSQRTGPRRPDQRGFGRSDRARARPGGDSLVAIMDRRTFMQRSAAAGGGLAAMGPLSALAARTAHGAPPRRRRATGRSCRRATSPSLPSSTTRSSTVRAFPCATAAPPPASSTPWAPTRTSATGFRAAATARSLSATTRTASAPGRSRSSPDPDSSTTSPPSAAIRSWSSSGA